MNVGLTISAQQTCRALGEFLTAVLPPGTGVFQSQTNRVAEPDEDDFVLMTNVGQLRLSTNVDDYADALFLGSIAGTVLTITDVDYGTIYVGSPVLGYQVLPNTVVVSFGTGMGGLGTYNINNSQAVASRPIACGTSTKLQPLQVTIQLDVHGPSSPDNCVIISTMFRDEYGVDKIAESGFDISPLYTGDARQLPFLNEAQQIEDRWVMEAVLQCNPVLTVPQEFADALSVTLIEVDAVYPPV